MKSPQRILVILGHPRPESFTEAMAQAYILGAQKAGAVVETCLLHALDFNPDVITEKPQAQYAEPDLVRAKERLLWASHLVFVTPVWWGTVPALLKGFLDRAFVPSFAFYERREGDYAQLLKGRTAELLLCLDTPVPIFRLFVGAPAVHSLKNATLNLCGVRPVKTHYFTPVSHSTPETKTAWLRKAEALGAHTATHGVATATDKAWMRATPWLKALRLQFYPMTFFAYCTGALLVKYLGETVHAGTFLAGYALIFLMEVIAVFINELNDLEADTRNTSYTPFNGGSRVLVNGDLQPAQLRKALQIITPLVLLLIAILAWQSRLPLWQPLVVSGALLLLAFGYTAPPFRLSYRTLGELTVGLTHSICVLLCGFVFQNGPVQSPLPWLLSLPLFLSILPSITLSNVPDRIADATVGKKTIAVRFGAQQAAWFALICTWLAAGAGLWLLLSGNPAGAYNWAILGAVAHAVWLTRELLRFIHLKEKPETIPKLMVLSLTYMMWYALLPFIRLL